MSQQKPLPNDITAALPGKPKMGRPAVGRSAVLPRIHPAVKKLAEAIAIQRVCSQAEAIEYALKHTAQHLGIKLPDETTAE